MFSRFESRAQAIATHAPGGRGGLQPWLGFHVIRSAENLSKAPVRSSDHRFVTGGTEYGTTSRTESIRSSVTGTSGDLKHCAPQGLEDENDTWVLFSDQYLDVVQAVEANDK